MTFADRFSSFSWKLGILSLGVFSFAYGEDRFASLDRLIREAQAREEWKTAATVDKKLNLIRDAALAKGVASDPVSQNDTCQSFSGPGAAWHQKA